jgi:hypothetical protein
MKTTATFRCALLASAIALLATSAHAQITTTTGTIFGTGYGSSPGGRDTNWKVVAVPNGFTPPSGQTLPYDLYVPVTVPGNFLATGNPQPGVPMLGGTNYWIAPQATTNSLIGGTYNWITQQQFYVPTAGFYRFDFQGAGDNELEFYIDGSVNTADSVRPTITGGQQIGGRAGTFTALSTFTGGAALTAGTHTASMVLWDYGGATAALIATSTFAPTVAYWAPSSGAGGNGTWNNSNSFWSPSADGAGTKLPWTSGVGVAYFGGTSGTVSVGENVNVSQIYFTTGGYTIQGGGGELVWGNGATITARSGTSTISATQTAGSGLKIGAGQGTVVLQGTTNLGWERQLLVDGGNLVINGVVNSPINNGSVYVGLGSLDGTGTINGTLAGLGKINPGPSGTASGILTTTQLNPTDGLDLRFVFSGTTPNYADANDSVNDVLRITGGAPFSASNTSANTIEIFFPNITEASQIAVGAKFLGGFFTDADASFLSSISSSTFTFYAYGDGNGPFSYKGSNYYALNDVAPGFLSTYTVSVGVEPTTANFAGGSSLGQVSTFTVIVPEPTATAMALAGVVFVACEIRRRRRSRPSGTIAA